MSSNPSRFVAKGGLVLGLAATAHSKHRTDWSHLGPALVNPARKLLSQLKDASDIIDLSSAVMCACRGEIPVQLPKWVSLCISQSQLLCRIGDDVVHQWPPDSSMHAPKGRTGGLSALAIALCRNIDVVNATAQYLFPDESSDFADMGAIAAVLSPPGLPSRIRKQIKALVESNLIGIQ